MAKPTTDIKFDPAVCMDIIGLQDLLKRLRLVDDSIILNLNTTVTTPLSQKEEQQNIASCKRLHDQLKVAYESRNNVINTCLGQAEELVSQLREAKLKNEADSNIVKEFKRHQTRLRMIQKETTVEQIIQDRSLKALQERCRRYVNF